MGDRPQGVLNRQLGVRCDMVVGTFWTRLGTPTGQADSGSVEEVEDAIRAGKPVLLYFSDTPAALTSIDTDQLERLRAFRERMEGKGLVDTYENTQDLIRKVSAALTRTVREKFHADLTEPAAVQARARLVARIERESRVRTLRDRVTSFNDFLLVIENVGGAPADEVTFRLMAGDGEEEADLPEVLSADRPVRRLVPGNPMRYALVVVMGTVSQFDIELAWKEGDQLHTDLQTLRW